MKSLSQGNVKSVSGIMVWDETNASEKPFYFLIQGVT